MMCHKHEVEYGRPFPKCPKCDTDTPTCEACNTDVPTDTPYTKEVPGYDDETETLVFCARCWRGSE